MQIDEQAFAYVNKAGGPALRMHREEAGGTVSVKSALRTLQILEAFAQAGRPMTLVEVSREIDAPRSSCLALLTTLAERGYLYRVGANMAYYPSRRWMDLATAVWEKDPLAVHIRASLERLRDLTGETTIDAVLAGDRSVYLDVVESRELVRYTARAGETKPLPVSASGRAQLAVLDEAERKALVAALPSGGGPDRPRFNRKALLETVDKERRRGWSINLGEFRPDVISVAVGFDLRGTVHSLVVAAPYHRVEARVDDLGRILRDEVRALQARLR